MPENKIKWTAQQAQAISARGGDVLVTASAGTGKTAVLSGRCVSFISDRKTCPDVMSLLVLTFTDAAAEQMRSRIGEQLKAQAESTGDRRLLQQLVLLQGADISTIHAFCKRLITEHFYQLGLDPTFSVIDADEAKLLKAEILGKTIEWAWQQDDLTSTLSKLLRRRNLDDNSGFLNRIIELSDFLDGVASRDNWYDRAEQLSRTTDITTSGLADAQRKHIALRLDAILSRLSHAKSIYENKVPGGPWAQKFDETHISPFEACLKALGDNKWDSFLEGMRSFKPTTRKPKDIDGPLDEMIQKIAKKAVDQFKDLKRLAVVHPEYLDLMAGAVTQQTQIMVELVRKFDQLYTHAKREANCLDFSDLEHLALKLLAGDRPDDSEKPSPTQTALDLRQRYRYIFVDEYQDINPVQQTILDMLSSGDNVFVVGDVKQSIYSWRGAQPDIFLQRLESGGTSDGNSQRVDLNTNFRSAKPILDFVNCLFFRIMTKSFCGTDYDQSAHLRPPPEDAVSDESPTGDLRSIEFHLLDETPKDPDEKEQASEDNPSDDDSGIVNARQRQAVFIAQRIRQLVGADTGQAELQIHDKQKDCSRGLEYRDIVILMRSLAKKANDYVEILRLAGIPVSCQTTAGYFEATEITDMLCLLKILDNPQRDIELAAVLRSPMFGVTDSDLANIQIHSKDESKSANFYSRLRHHIDTGSDSELARKLTDSLTLIDQWRTFARKGSLADLIWTIYRSTNYLSFISALPDGQARRANLLKLHDRAIQFEGFVSASGSPSLTRFVEFIEKLQETGQDWAPAEPEAAAGNAVRILSVHKSKGLEFPVVFLAELDTKFNTRSISADVLADSKYALGIQIIDPDSNTKLTSLAHQVIAEQKRSVSLAEEMRILYVATTRAKDKLILTAARKKDSCERIITNGYYFGDGPIPDWQLRSAGSPLEWILYSLSNQQSLHEAFETGLASRTQDDSLFSFQLLSGQQLSDLSDCVEKLRKTKLAHSTPKASRSHKKSAQSPLLSKTKQSLAWQYPFNGVPKLPAKTSVSDLTHQADEFTRLDCSGALTRRPVSLSTTEPGQSSNIDPRLLGSATHLLIAQLDLTTLVTHESVDETISHMLDRNAVTADVAKCIDIESILAFFETDLGKMALDPKNKVFREWPFTFSLPAWELAGTEFEQSVGCDETAVVQGIIDMLIKRPDGLIVIDFKTDKITSAQLSQRGELYRRQLDLYARAASAILSVPTITKTLYFLVPRQVYKW